MAEGGADAAAAQDVSDALRHQLSEPVAHETVDEGVDGSVEIAEPVDEQGDADSGVCADADVVAQGELDHADEVGGGVGQDVHDGERKKHSGDFQAPVELTQTHDGKSAQAARLRLRHGVQAAQHATVGEHHEERGCHEEQRCPRAQVDALHSLRPSRGALGEQHGVHGQLRRRHCG